MSYKLSKGSLGDRMKSFYENITRFFLLRRTYTIIRIDGKSFHGYTRGLQMPFDDGLMDDMDATASYLCKNIMGAKFAFVQSDEISILITDFDEHMTQAWFGNNLQKMCSISASMATSKFNKLRILRFVMEKYNNGISTITDTWLDNLEKMKDAEFDSRVFQLPTKTEVENYFIWRQQDTTTNSISSVAQSLYSYTDLNNKSCDAMQEMIFQKGINWNDYDARHKRGRMIIKEIYLKGDTNRTRWTSAAPPIFTQDREYLDLLIPNNE